MTRSAHGDTNSRIANSYLKRLFADEVIVHQVHLTVAPLLNACYRHHARNHSQ